MRNRGRKWKRDQRPFLWRRKSELEGPWASEGVGVECRTKAVKRMQKKANKSFSSTDLQWVTERTRAENRSAQIDTFRDVAKY